MSAQYNDCCTIADALWLATEELTGISTTPRLDAEVLLMTVCGLSRVQLVTRAGDVMTEEQTRGLHALSRRRKHGEPIAYLTGAREFWSLALAVSTATLIPRPETEVLVEQALALVPADAQWLIADIGTGCGAIALALAKERPGCRLIATDSSRNALRTAEGNAARLGIENIELRHGDWLAPLAGEVIDMLVSNPPYVPTNDPCLTGGEARFEPLEARAAGTDGLDAVRHLVAHAPVHLRAGGWLLLEHGCDQARAVGALMRRRGYREVACVRDLGGRERVSRARWR